MLTWTTPTVTEMTRAEVRKAVVAERREARAADPIKVARASKYKQWRAAQPEEKSAERARRSGERYREIDPAERLLRHAKYQMTGLGAETDLTLEDIVVGESCQCCGQVYGQPAPFGTPVEHQRKTVRENCGPRAGNLPSLDRIDSAKGYVRGNVAVICWDCNRRKRDSTPEQLQNIVAYLQRVTPCR